jgi:D-arginine dehydrogenase
MIDCDFLIVGGGIAGASAAWALAAGARVALLEAEERCGYHSTGRSAALFADAHGAPVPRALGAASRPFFEQPPPGFCDVPLVTPRGALQIARADQRAALRRVIDGGLDRLSVDEALRVVPVLRPDYVAGAALEPGAMDIDVDALLQGFLRGLEARGGTVHTRSRIVALERRGGRWIGATATSLAFRAPTVINAAGAWADEIARLAGVRPIGLRPLRRTAFLVRPDGGRDVTRWPMVIDVDETFYFKPDAGRLLVSPEDETPLPPCDVRPDELDVAVGADRLQRATSLTVVSVEKSWAGLRSFVADRAPVVGFAPDAPGFFWLAGQGGFGILTSPALARVAAALAARRPLPEDVTARGISVDDLGPRRLW